MTMIIIALWSEKLSCENCLPIELQWLLLLPRYLPR